MTENLRLLNFIVILLKLIDDYNESFGDFIGGPTGSNSITQPNAAQQMTAQIDTGSPASIETNGNQSPRGGNTEKKEEKKGW